MAHVDPLTHLPNDLSLLILSNLSLQELTRCGEVSTGWREISNNRILWELLWNKMFPEITIPSESHPKKYFIVDKSSLYSYEGLLIRIAKFASEVPLGGKGLFTCKFPPDFKYTLTIKLVYKDSLELLRILFGKPDMLRSQIKDSYTFREELKSGDSMKINSERDFYSDDHFSKDIDIKLPTSKYVNKVIKIVDKQIMIKVKSQIQRGMHISLVMIMITFIFFTTIMHLKNGILYGNHHI